MAKKTTTKKTESATAARPKPQNKSEGVVPVKAAPPKVVTGHMNGVIMKDATMRYHEVAPMEPLKIEVPKPKSSSATPSIRVEGSKNGAVVHGASGNKPKAKVNAGQAPPIST